MKTYRETHDYLLKLQRKNDTVFNCALQQIMDDGVNKCSLYDIEKAKNEIPENSIFNKDMQIEIFKTAKEISLNVKPWHIYIFFKEEIATFERTKMGYDSLKKILQRVLEYVMYPLDGSDHLGKDELMKIMQLDDEEDWDEIWR